MVPLTIEECTFLWIHSPVMIFGFIIKSCFEVIQRLYLEAKSTTEVKNVLMLHAPGLLPSASTFIQRKRMVF